MFTKAVEQGGGKKIAFESAAVNSGKDTQHLLLAPTFKVLLMRQKRLYLLL